MGNLGIAIQISFWLSEDLDAGLMVLRSVE
jgi:hypothetical protein